MKICVFGSCGYVGSSVYSRLRNEWGNSVVGTYRNEALFSNLVQLDMNEPEAFSSFFKQEKPDVVVWAAMAGPKEYQLSENGLIHLLAHLNPLIKLVYLSSDFVFSAGRGPYEERDVLCTMPDGKMYSQYANAKVKAEKLIQQELTNYIILRTGPVFGKNALGRRDGHTEELIQQLEANEPAAYRNDLVRTFVHIDDFTDVIAELIRTNLTGVYHVGRSRPQNFYEFMTERASSLGYDPDLVVLDEKKETMQAQPENLGLRTDRIEQMTRVTFR